MQLQQIAGGTQQLARWQPKRAQRTLSASRVACITRTPRATSFCAGLLQQKPLSCLHLRLQSKTRVVSASAWKDNRDAEVNKDEPDEFRQAFLRSFLLGLGAGCIAETVHVTSKFVGVVGQVAQDQQLSQLGNMLPSLSHQFAPLFAADHAIAIAFWALFYVMEAGAILSILSQHGGNHEAAVESLRTLKTLPRILLPTRFRLMRAILKFTGRLQPAAAALPAAHSGVVKSPRRQSPAPPRNALAFLDSGESVLEAPQPPPSYPRSISAPSGPLSNVVPLPPSISSKGQPVVEPAPGKDADKDRLRRTVPGKVARPEKSESQWAHRSKELLSRRLYLKNMWYAAALSQNVGKDPVGVEMLSEKIVLFRDETGKVVAINDVCPHRGAPLHQGWVSSVEGDSCVVCPYHGWAFDGEGHARDVPASPNKKDWPKKPVLSSYDVEEKGGFVWLFNGSQALPRDARPPIPHTAELDDPKWKPVYGEIEFKCGHWSVFENAIDMAHIHYLHSDSFGNKDAPSIREMKAERGPYSVSATFSLTNKPVNALWEWSKVPEVHVTAQAHLPSTSVISFTLGNGLSFTTFVNTVPINDNRSINRFALIRNLDSPVFPGAINAIFNANIWDKFAHDAMIKILSEDKAMVEELRPDLLQREVNVKADGVQTAFRLLRQEYVNLGYGVLPYVSKEL